MADSDMLAAAKAEVVRLEANCGPPLPIRASTRQAGCGLYEHIPGIRFNRREAAAPAQVVEHIAQSAP